MIKLSQKFLTKNYSGFSHKNIKFEISLRKYVKPNNFSIIDFIASEYPFLSISQINSIYGFHTEFSRLYGGRSFVPSETIDDEDLDELYNNNINFYIPLSNHYIDKSTYELSKPFLDKHHRVGNSIVCYSNQLAKWIATDFPDYQLIASVIKNITNLDHINKLFATYHKVVLPPQLNTNLDLLEKIEEKDRIILFANNTCRINCDAWVCYHSISKGIRDIENPHQATGSIPAKKGLFCSQQHKQQSDNYIEFDLNIYADLGITNFKLIPPNSRKINAYKIQSLNSEAIKISLTPDWKDKFTSEQFKSSIAEEKNGIICISKSFNLILNLLKEERSGSDFLESVYKQADNLESVEIKNLLTLLLNCQLLQIK